MARDVSKTRGIRWLVSLLSACLAILVLLLPSGRGTADAAGPPAVTSTATDTYVVLAWNDLGMHCYNASFADLAVLPPYNTLYAQVVRVGDQPAIVTQGVTVEYSFPPNPAYSYTGNSTSTSKTDFWQFVGSLFGASPPANEGLKGKGLADFMDPAGDHFIAEGIPLTEFADGDLANRYPYQLALVVARDAATGTELARATVVAPVSSEMNCTGCHSDTGDATTAYPITPTGSIDTNILTLHDYLSQSRYPAGRTASLMSSRPVLCAGCHSSNALGAPGMPGVSSLSNAMHSHHQSLPDITPNTNGCYNCHPGMETQCLRDTMSQNSGFTCVTCHGTMTTVASNSDPWLKEPRCDNSTCHGSSYALSDNLYRWSKGHGGLYCAGCHDSPHAIAPSREPNDAIKFVDLQQQTGTLRQCSVCHTSQPSAFQHTLMWWRCYIPAIAH